MSNGARPIAEWNEEDGPVLWWCFPIAEAPYVGTPLDLGHTVEVEVRTFATVEVSRHQVGGWPGYHTHWTPVPTAPAEPPRGRGTADCVRQAEAAGVKVIRPGGEA